MRPLLAFLRFTLAQRRWALQLGLGVGLLGVMAPWVPGVGSAAELWAALPHVLIPLVAIAVAFLLGVAAALEDRQAVTYFLARPLGATALALTRLGVDLATAAAAGVAAGVPAMLANLATGQALAATVWLSVTPTDIANSVPMLLLFTLPIPRVVGELSAAAGLDRSASVALDVVGVLAAAWLVATTQGIVRLGAATLTAVAILVTLVVLTVALVAAATRRLSVGRGDERRAHRAGAIALAVALAPAALAVDQWHRHVEGPARASDLDEVSGVFATGVDDLFFLWGHTRTRFDLPVGALADARGTMPRLSANWVIPASASAQLALALHPVADEGVGVTLLRRNQQGELELTPSPVVFAQHPRSGPTVVAAVSDDGQFLARYRKGELFLWELESGRLLGSTRIVPGLAWTQVYFDGNRATVARFGVDTEGGSVLQVESLGPARDVARTLVPAPADHRTFLVVFADRLVVVGEREVVITTLAGEPIARSELLRRRYGPGYPALAGDGTLVVSTHDEHGRYLELFAANGDPLGTSEFAAPWHPCGWIGPRTLLMRVGEGLAPLDLDDIADGHLTGGQLAGGDLTGGPGDAIPGSWRCLPTSFPPIPGRGIALRSEPDGALAVWSHQAGRPVLLGELTDR